MNVKDTNEKFLQPCDKYFCHYCLKGSYQVNIDSNEVETKEKDKESLNLDKKESNKTKSFKVIKSSKDWCCPCCTNECFCSRCTREEQIFKLLGLYFYYNGNLSELLSNVLRNSLLSNLKNDLLLSYLEIKDYSFSERTCKKKNEEESTIVLPSINKNIKRIRSRSMKKIISSRTLTNKKMNKHKTDSNDIHENQIKEIELQIDQYQKINTVLEGERDKISNLINPLSEFEKIVSKTKKLERNERFERINRDSEAEFKLGKIRNFKKFNKERMISYVENNVNRVKHNLSLSLSRDNMRDNSNLDLKENGVDIKNKNVKSKNKKDNSLIKKKEKLIKSNIERIRFSKRLNSSRMLRNKRSN